ncbi:MAG: DUF1800 family protein [Verrucomicrobia bacterium]|nr:MAG: DUF1800 family protein [Verrucomicrobiota bacterium]
MRDLHVSRNRAAAAPSAWRRGWSWWLTAGLVAPALAGDLRLTVEPSRARIDFEPQPAVERYAVEQAPSPLGPYGVGGVLSTADYHWEGSATGPHAFYRLAMEPLSDRAILAAIVLNRLAYGPTPDWLDRLRDTAKGWTPEAWIRQQLQPETITETLDQPPPKLDWQRVVVTGIASSSRLYIYPSQAGEVYIDDIRLVEGTDPDQGVNLVANGDFEVPIETAWNVSANLAGSSLSTDIKHSGRSALHLVATSGGTTRSSAIWQEINPPLRRRATYTLSYWYLPTPQGENLTLRLSGAGSYPGTGIDSTHSLMPVEFLPGVLYERLRAGQATIDDLRAWVLLHAVRSERQLLQVLLAFWDNHFTTLYSKSRDWLNGRLDDPVEARRAAAGFEFREWDRWRNLLLDPNATFHDLLVASAESPAMIIYLDTVNNRKGKANENYARELLELFTMGVDNGYDQTDIEQLARVWTGWRVAKLPPDQADNPLAEPVADPNTDPGIWTFWYDPSRHDSGGKVLFRARVVDARFGPPYSGTSMQLVIQPRRPADGWQEGYEVLKHLANLPQTQEFISVKLCRLFVHENFQHGVYDYTAPDLSPEGRLVRACMEAWNRRAADGRRGNLRAVLEAIFASDLFRGRAALRQKVTTPLEFVVRSVRAFRTPRPEGGWTADTDGYDLIEPLERMNMPIFEREDPDGWPEAGRDWVSSAGLIERMRFTQHLVAAPRSVVKLAEYGRGHGDNVADPTAVVRARLEGNRQRDPAQVVETLLELLFPGEGRDNLAPDRALAIEFLNTDAAGNPAATPFRDLSPDSPEYDQRIRSLAALLLALPRIQEQ